MYELALPIGLAVPTPQYPLLRERPRVGQHESRAVVLAWVLLGHVAAMRLLLAVSEPAPAFHEPQVIRVYSLASPRLPALPSLQTPLRRRPPPSHNQARRDASIPPPASHASLAPQRVAFALNTVRLSAPLSGDAAPAIPAASPATLDARATVTSSADTAVPASSAEPPVTPPSFHADYLANPTPEYPPASRRMGEEGIVRLRVQVSAEGQPLEIRLDAGSGHPRLDQAALDAVAAWRFVPARLGEQAVVGWVLVPIHFSLRRAR